mgnify:CR=1 FL=1
MTASHKSIDLVNEGINFSHESGLAALPIPKQSRSFLHLVGNSGQLKIHSAPFRGTFSVVLSEALRSAGLGSRVLVAQFLKGGVQQGPKNSVKLCGKLEWLRPSLSCCITKENLEASDQESKINLRNAVEAIWNVCKEQIINQKIDQIVLDEIGLAISLGLLSKKDIISILTERPKSIDFILTGPAIPQEAMDMADQITQLRCSN